MTGLTHVEAWAAITRTFGATAVVPVIDPSCTEAATRAAVARVREVAVDGACASRSPPRSRRRCCHCTSRSPRSPAPGAPRSSTSPTSGPSGPTAARRAGCAGSAASRSSATGGPCATRPTPRRPASGSSRPRARRSSSPTGRSRRSRRRPVSRSWRSPVSTDRDSPSRRARSGRSTVVPMRTDRAGPGLRGARTPGRGSADRAGGPGRRTGPSWGPDRRPDRPNVTSHTPRELTLDNSDPTGVRSFFSGWSREFPRGQWIEQVALSDGAGSRGI